MAAIDPARLDFFGEAIDRMVTVEIKNTGLPHGVLRPMYDAARALSVRPISTTCAERLVAAVGPGDVVFILTGAGYSPTLAKGESDGPPGAASLARALYKGLGAVPVFVVEECHAEPLVASSVAAGLMVRELCHAKQNRLGAGLITAPRQQQAVPAWTEELFTTQQPRAVISAERLGAARDGVIYGATAIPFSGPASRMEYSAVDIGEVMTAARQRGILTIGVGDHGNELGFGSIRDAVVAAMPRGETVCAEAAANLPFPAMMSNWGCYGIEAALACVLATPELLHRPEQEAFILRACLQAGGVEAMWASSEFVVDGLDGETSMACLQVLRAIVAKYMEDTSPGLAH